MLLRRRDRGGAAAHALPGTAATIIIYPATGSTVARRPPRPSFLTQPRPGVIADGGHGSESARSAPVPGRSKVKRAAISENNGAGGLANASAAEDGRTPRPPLLIAPFQEPQLAALSSMC